MVVTATAHSTGLHYLTQSITIMQEKQFSTWQPNHLKFSQGRSVSKLAVLQSTEQRKIPEFSTSLP
ncbi:MAG: hypothetical protein KC545_02415, partial [Nitrospira sp.]|nr:hypothetical protein [Nitrospira sp.]